MVDRSGIVAQSVSHIPCLHIDLQSVHSICLLICSQIPVSHTRLLYSYVSPRIRAQRTFELLGLRRGNEQLPWDRHGGNGDEESSAEPGSCLADVEVTDLIREWDYGEYEGITSAEIRDIRRRDGMLGTWDIWKDGCPGGE